MSMLSTPDYDEETRYLRGVVRSLLADEAAVDDVVQDVWVASLGRHLEPGTRRGWLRWTARHQVLRRRRDRGRARAHEATYAQDVDVLLEDARAERASTAAFLRTELEGLGEPYEEALRLVYFEGLSFEQAATRLGVPTGTLKARVHRGVGRLRERLLPRYGHARNLGIVLIACFDWDAEDLEVVGVRGTAAGAVASGGGVWWITALLLAPIVGLTSWWWSTGAGGEPGSPQAPGQAPRVEQAPLADGERAQAKTDGALARAVPDSAAEAGASPVAKEPATLPEPEEAPHSFTATLTVTDGDGSVVAGAEVFVEAPAGRRTLGATDALGKLAARLRSEDVRDDDPALGDYVTLWARHDGMADSDLYLVRMQASPAELSLALRGPAVFLRAMVIDSERRGITGAKVVVGPPTLVVSRTERYVVQRMAATQVSDHEGWVYFRHLPHGGLDLHVSAEGYSPLLGAIHSRGQDEMAYSFPLPAGFEVRGVAVDERGLPVEGALAYRYASTPNDPFRATTDAEGRFVLPGLREGEHRVWVRHGRAAAWANLPAGPEHGGVHEFILRERHHLTVRPVARSGETLMLATCRVFAADVGTATAPYHEFEERGVLNEAGLIEFHECPADVPLRVVVTDSRFVGAVGVVDVPRAGASGVVEVPCALPGEEVARLRGRIDFQGNPPRGAAHVLVVPRGQVGVLHAPLGADGQFDVAALVPGDYDLYVSVSTQKTFPHIGTVEVLAGADIDLRTLSAPGVVQLEIAHVTQGTPSWHLSTRYGASDLETLAYGTVTTDLAYEFFPNDYRLTVEGSDFRWSRTFALLPETPLRLEAGPNAPFPVSVEVVASGPVDLRVVAIDPDSGASNHEVIAETEPVVEERAAEPGDHMFLLPHGSYLVVAEGEAGERGTTRIDVGAEQELIHARVEIVE